MPLGEKAIGATVNHLADTVRNPDRNQMSKYSWHTWRTFLMADGVATKKDPKKWAAAKSQAKVRMGGKHSARAMQLATKIYKKERWWLRR